MTENKQTDNIEAVISEEKSCECGEMNVLECASSNNFNYGLEEMFVMSDIEDRKLFINGEITPETRANISYHIMRYNALDIDVPVTERTPIIIYISSTGGSMWDGMGICDCIKNSKTPVIGVCTSYALSMGFYIYISCHKRYASENAFFLNHEGRDGDYGSPSKVDDYWRFGQKYKERLMQFVVSRTKLSIKGLKKTERIENYYFADEAKTLGIVDSIIGKDCDIDEVV